MKCFSVWSGVVAESWCLSCVYMYMCMLQSVINSVSFKRIMPRRSRLVAVLLMPIAVFLWCVGWSLYWIGLSRESLKPRMIREADELSFGVLLPENKVEA